MLNEDYRDMLQALADERARFLLVGAYALAAHGYPRATVDIDIWIMQSPKNADAVLRALRRFGTPLQNLTVQDLQEDDTVFQIGVAPRRIDIITTASGLRFEEAYAHSMALDIEGIEVHIPSLQINADAIGREDVISVLLSFPADSVAFRRHPCRGLEKRWATIRSQVKSAKAAWARCIGRGIRGSIGKLR